MQWLEHMNNTGEHLGAWPLSECEWGAREENLPACMRFTQVGLLGLAALLWPLPANLHSRGANFSFDVVP